MNNYYVYVTVWSNNEIENYTRFPYKICLVDDNISIGSFLYDKQELHIILPIIKKIVDNNKYALLYYKHENALIRNLCYTKLTYCKDKNMEIKVNKDSILLTLTLKELNFDYE